MSREIGLEQLKELTEELSAILISVAEDPTVAEDLDSDYRRLHLALRRALRIRKGKCFCVWTSAHGWIAKAYELGDPGWREWLAHQVALIDTAGGHTAPKPKYKLVVYRRNGDPQDEPFRKWAEKLEGHKQVALKQAIQRQLLVLGPAIASDQRVGRWISKDRKPGHRYLEFKVQIDASDLNTVNPDGSPCDSGYPKQKIELRVGCCMSADNLAVVIFDGFDKGREPKKQERKIREWHKMLTDYRQQEAAVRKSARRQGLKT